MRLLNGYILIRLDELETKTQSGIYLQDKTVRLPSTGVIEEVSGGIEEVKKGDKVEFLRYASIDGIDPDTRICKLEHIIGVYEG